ncbi:transposase [Mesorhizobium humile]|uniref:transposase n=1 Tax=Mesorhizobium humile TaxID=3072313 RepID=UPI003D31AEAF
MRLDARARRLLSTQGIGPIMALTYAVRSTTPGRFRSLKRAGAHFGLTPKKCQFPEPTIAAASARSGMPQCASAL